MRKVLGLLRKFWTAEEVPRWFGLSIVLVYLSGVGAVAFFGLSELRRESQSQNGKYKQYALDALGSQLSRIPCTGREKFKIAGDVRAFLYDFASRLPVSSLRLVNHDRRILASIDADEVGTIAISELAAYRAPASGKGCVVHRDFKGNTVFLARTPVTAPGLADQLTKLKSSRSKPVQEALTAEPSDRPGQAEQAEDVHLEAAFLLSMQDGSFVAAYAQSGVVILVLLGIFFVLHRCLRRKLRSLSLIGRRLEASHGRVADTLSALTLSDDADVVTSTWNQLVDLAQSLSEDACRNDADAELARSLARSGGGALAEALQSMPDGLVLINEEGLLVYTNAAAQRLTGISVTQAQPVRVEELELVGLGAKVAALIARSGHSNDTYVPLSEMMEVASNQSDGEAPAGPEGYFRVWILPIVDSCRDGGCLVVIRDVSQQIRADRAREEFVTQVTHELRTPLTNIRAYAETLSSGMFDDPNVVTECYNVINKETRRLSRLIEDILNVSQMEVATISLNMQSVDLKSLLGEAVRDVRGLADEKNIDMQLALPAKMEPVTADRDKLAVVLNNLLGNAIKYTPADGNVVIGCQQKPESVVITVKDNGFGIAPEEHARIFEKFQRASDERVRSQSGTGIGLYTARELVRRHGGDIELFSEKNQGSTFLVRIPHQANRATVLSTSEEA